MHHKLTGGPIDEGENRFVQLGVERWQTVHFVCPHHHRHPLDSIENCSAPIETHELWVILPDQVILPRLLNKLRLNRYSEI